MAGRDREELDEKLDAIAFGVFIPVFFVVTGVTFDLAALGTEPALWRLPVFLAMFWIARGLPALFIYRGVLPDRADRIDFSLLTSTQLPIVVAIAAIGVESGKMRPYTASALVGAGMISVLLFPMIAEIRRGRRRASDPAAAAAAAGADPPASTA